MTPVAPESLMLDLVAFVAARPRPYAEVIEAWRTSCPRLTVWEDTVDAGLVAFRADGQVVATPKGLSALSGRN
ncbi:hypothetical protein EOD42_10865 [Rhodovarius crocodyli]|uniref:Uncharacterized protein n=1 Tax=Rhodovarius crocodyli TaxID=1979269 RepID=A0A437MGX8_9PROT|nr:hypothetical protein [Rhodovarius crocodyli]RVT96896.1 hypothetical protein EOD42_10865 [Rhodovarius crocodyli]